MKEDIFFNPARPNQRGNYMITNFVSNYDDLGRTSIERMIQYVDKDIDYLQKSESQGIIQKLAMYLNLTNPLEWIFLVFFSVVLTIYLMFVDKLMDLAFDNRRHIATSSSPIFNFLWWNITGVLLFLLSTSCGYFISAESDGSGIPEMKTVLSGINIYRYFRVINFMTKIMKLL